MISKTKLAVLALIGGAVLGGVGYIKTETTKPGVKSEVATPAMPSIDVSKHMSTGDLKIRYIDAFTAMRDCKQGMEEVAKLEQRRVELAKKIDTEGKKYEALVNEFKAKSATMNETARAKKEQELVRMKRDYESMVQGSEEEMKLVMQQVTELLGREIEQAVTQIAQAEGLDAVVDKVTGRVLYTSNKSDCTARVVQVMDKNHSVKVAKAGTKSVA